MPKIRDFNRVTALYERLSKDDEQQGESNSILNQKRFLEDFARKSGMTNIKHFTDDGYTGRNFNRPGFQAMLAEAEAWKIGTIIVKDMSRFCRNYLEVGFYTEILFPKKQIRFIAINNSVRAMLRIEPKPRRNAGRRMTVISTRSVSANSAAKRFIRTAQGRGFATPTVQNSISRQKHCFLGW